MSDTARTGSAARGGSTREPARDARFTDLPARLDAVGWSLVRARPRTSEHALLEIAAPDGAVVAGQWFATPERAAMVADQTVGAAWSTAVEQPVPEVVAQPGGADRRLRQLASRCAEGARLRSHRPERRAVLEVVHDGRPAFVKMVRDGRLTPQLVRASGIRIPGVPTPELLAVDRATASLTTAGLPGTTLHELLRAGRIAPDDLVAVGASLARFHAAPIPDGVPEHGRAQELAVVDRWLGLARELVDDGIGELAAAAHRALPAALARSGGRRALLHRDLHDKQIVLGGDEPALLDLDLLALGDAALDLANLLVHLELRAHQRLVTEEAARTLADALVQGYRPDRAIRDAVPAYLLATRLRLAAVYAFRPPSHDASRRLLTDPLIQEIS